GVSTRSSSWPVPGVIPILLLSYYTSSSRPSPRWVGQAPPPPTRPSPQVLALGASPPARWAKERGPARLQRPERPWEQSPRRTRRPRQPTVPRRPGGPREHTTLALRRIRDEPGIGNPNVDTYLVAYDICNPKRLRKVATTCEDFGIRRQYSVFIC